MSVHRDELAKFLVGSIVDDMDGFENLCLDHEGRTWAYFRRVDGELVFDTLSQETVYAPTNKLVEVVIDWSDTVNYVKKARAVDLSDPGDVFGEWYSVEEYL